MVWEENFDAARDTISDREKTVAGENATGSRLIYGKRDRRKVWLRGYLSDETIIDLFFERSEEAIESAMDKYGVLLRSLAWNVLGNREDVEECLNDTYLGGLELNSSGAPEVPESLCMQNSAQQCAWSRQGEE